MCHFKSESLLGKFFPVIYVNIYIDILSVSCFFSEPSQRPAIQDAGNRCFEADLRGRGSPAPLYQRVVRPDWSGSSKYLVSKAPQVTLCCDGGRTFEKAHERLTWNSPPQLLPPQHKKAALRQSSAFMRVLTTFKDKVLTVNHKPPLI